MVFQADLSSLGEDGTNWELSFGGRTFPGGGPNGGQLSCDPSPGCSSAAGIEFSTDGSSHASVGSVNLPPADRPFVVPLSVVSSQTAFVRLSLDPTNGQPLIDNLAISATLPEPGGTGSLLVGLAFLAALGHRRSRRVRMGH